MFRSLLIYSNFAPVFPQTPVKLVSAMKGGREQKGTPLLLKMNVTWAPDVHDPPATSLSHTVKSHHQYQRPKAKKKKDQKQKRKGKSARGSSNEKKHQDNSSVGGNGHMQLRSLSLYVFFLPCIESICSARLPGDLIMCEPLFYFYVFFLQATIFW